MSYQSENLDQLFTALSKAQSKFKKAQKTNNNPFFKSKYSSLEDVRDASIEALGENGLCVIQKFERDSSNYILVTILGHTSGQWIRSEVLLPMTKITPQDFGSCSTYFKRYSYAAIIGVVSGEVDDDGETAQSAFRKLSEAQCAELDTYLDQFPESEAALCQRYRVQSVYEIPVQDFAYVISGFKTKMQKKNGDKNG